MKYLPYIIICLLVASACKTSTPSKQKLAINKQLTIASKDSALQAYKSQKHRFKVELCKLYYNDQHIRLDSIHLVEKIFGNNHVKNIGNFYYKDVPLSFLSHQIRYSKDSITRMVERLYIRFGHSTEYQENIDQGYPSLNSREDSIINASPVLKGYILIDGQLVHSNSTLEEINAYRKQHKLPLFKTFLGDVLDQIIGYGSNYCNPKLRNEPERYTTFVSLYFDESSNYHEHKPDYHRTNILGFHYSYEQQY